MSYSSDGTHWYDQEGNPKYTIIGANGAERNTTLRDARKYNYVPSVTSIMNIISKPSLEHWKLTQALKSSVIIPRKEDESLESFIYRCIQDSKDIGLNAAKEGTKIHDLIEKGFTDNVKSTPYKIIREYLDVHYPNQEWIAEGSFCSKLGYGGKIDLHSKEGIFIDFKTKDNILNKEPSKLAYDEYGMQLSAYAQGCGFTEKAERLSIFIDRQDTSCVSYYKWDEDTHSKHRDMFNNILSYWQLVKNYSPKSKEEGNEHK